MARSLLPSRYRKGARKDRALIAFKQWRGNVAATLAKLGVRAGCWDTFPSRYRA